MADDRLGLPEGFELDAKPPEGFIEDKAPVLPDNSEDVLSMSATFDIPPSQAYENHDFLKAELEKQNLWGTAGKSFMSGIGDVYSTTGSALKWAGADEQAEVYGDFGKRLQKAYSVSIPPEEFTWKRVIDPEWWATTATRSVPFTLSLMPAAILAAYGGGATAGALGMGTFGRLVLGSIGGASVSRPLESALEAGNTYQSELDKGKSEVEANEAANSVFKGNLALTGLDIAEFATAFTPLRVLGKTASKSLALRILATGGKLGAVGGMEAGEEGYQEALQRMAVGDEVKFDPAMKEAMTIGGIFGVGMGGTGSVYTALRDKVVNTMPPEMKAEVDKIETEAVKEGLPQQQAELKALDEIADTPEGKAHIEQAIETLKDPTKEVEEGLKTGVFHEYDPSMRAGGFGVENVPLTNLGYAPESEVTVYRGVPKGTKNINDGDWVTTLKQLAQDYAGTGDVISIKAKAKYLFAEEGDTALEELVYSSKQEQFGKTEQLPAEPIAKVEEGEKVAPEAAGEVTAPLEEYSIEGKHKYNYVHNTEKAPKPGAEDTYGQNIEPAGKYMNLLTERGAKRSAEKEIKNWELGTIEFKNPLFIEALGTSKEWKTALSEQYGGLTGKALSEAISKDGYDGIITMSKGQPSEVVSFAPTPTPAAKVEKPPIPTEEPISEYEIGELNKVDEQITAQASRQAEINVYKRLEKGKAKDEREIAKLAQGDIDEIPVYKAMAEIKKRGGLNLAKLSKDYSIEERAALTRAYPGLVSKTGTVTLDEIADELGYKDDTALMNEMLDAPTKAQAKQKYIDDFYANYYGDMIEAGEDILPMLQAEESKLLKEATKKYKIKPAKGLKKFIREESGQVKVKEIIEVKPGEILEFAMKEAQKAARVAFRAGDREGIARAKAKYREALEKKRARDYTRDVIKKIVKDLKKVDVEKLTPAQSEPVKNLLAGLDFTKPTSKTLLKLTKTREYLENNPEAELPDHVMERLSRLDKQNVRDITLEELESIHDAVMHRVHLSKLTNKIKVRRKLQEEAEVLKDSIKEMKPRKNVQADIVSSQQGESGRKGVGELIKDTFGIRHDHYDLIIETLAGPNSMMDKVLYQEVKDGVIAQLKYRQDVYKNFESEANKIGIKDISTWLVEEVNTVKGKLTRNQRMALYKHSQNADNRRAIIGGGFGVKSEDDPNHVFNVTETELSEILNSLTKEEIAFADIWDELSEKQYKALNKVFLEKNGYNLPQEEFYYPKDTMPLARGKDFESEEALDKFKGTWTRVGIEKGMLEKRRRVQLPIYLNSFTYDVNKSVMKSAAYVGLELPLSNASKLLYNPDFKRELTERYGKITWAEIEKGLRDIAGDWQSYTTTEELLLKVKNNITTAILGLNPFVMAKQVLSLPVYLPYVKAEYLVQATTEYMGNTKEIDARHDLYSPEWVERIAGGYSRDVADIFKGAAEKRLYSGKKSFQESVMGGIKLLDKGAVGPGMHGAVLQVLDEFKAGELSERVAIALDIKNEDIATLTPEDKMRLAYRYADFATERTQPMFSVEHRSSLSRGATVEKLATMFGAFTNQALNLTRRAGREGARTGNYDTLAKTLFVLFIVNTMGVMAIDEVRNRIYKRDGGNVYGRILNSWAGYVFFLRDLASSVISKIERGTFMGYDVSWPITKVPELMSDVIANGVGMVTEKNKAKREKMAGRFVDDALNLGLMLNGIPYQTPKKLIKAAVEATK